MSNCPRRYTSGPPRDSNYQNQTVNNISTARLLRACQLSLRTEDDLVQIFENALDDPEVAQVVLCELLNNTAAPPPGVTLAPVNLYEDVDTGECYVRGPQSTTEIPTVACNFYSPDLVGRAYSNGGEYWAITYTPLQFHVEQNGVWTNLLTPEILLGAIDQTMDNWNAVAVPGSPELPSYWLKYLNGYVFPLVDPANTYGFTAVADSTGGYDHQIRVTSSTTLTNFIFLFCKTWVDYDGSGGHGGPFGELYAYFRDGGVIPVGSGVSGAPFPGESVVIGANTSNCDFNGGDDPTVDAWYTADSLDLFAGTAAYNNPVCTPGAVITVSKSLELGDTGLLQTSEGPTNHVNRQLQRSAVLIKKDTLMDPLVKYPITSWDQAGDLLKERVEQVIRLVSAGIFNKDELKVAVYGSQISGKAGKTPDIDMAVYHPTLESMAPQDRRKIFKSVKDEVDFALDLGFMVMKWLDTKGVRVQ
jgi:hypothetical protein